MEGDWRLDRHSAEFADIGSLAKRMRESLRAEVSSSIVLILLAGYAQGLHIWMVLGPTGAR